VARTRKDDDEDDDGLTPYGRLRESFQVGGLSIAGFPISIGHLLLGAGILGLLFFAITHVMGNLCN
jgi:CO dehydrogenase/acetyl-CoA synthase alpha subunit